MQDYMPVTQVEMLLSHPDGAQRCNMLHCLNVCDPKFLFDSSARVDYGLPVAYYVDWYRDDVRIDNACLVGSFIDFRYTLRSYAYPQMLTYILRNADWKVNCRYRTIDTVTDTPWAEMRFAGRWTHDYEPHFPHGWSARADRRRQEGRL